MSIFNMVMEAMTPTYDEKFCELVALESDLDCLDQFREACGAPAFESTNSRVRVMAATEALNQLARHGNLAAELDEPAPQKPNYSAAFEAINAGLDTSINPEMKEEILASQRQTAMNFFSALEEFLGEDFYYED